MDGAQLAYLLEVLSRQSASAWLSVRGASMSPWIKNNDRIRIEPLPEHGLAPGEIAAYRHQPSGMLLVHRIVRCRQGQCWLKGDNHRGASDGPVSREQILGVVRAVERNGKPVRWGMGREKRLLALLSRASLLQVGLSILRSVRSVLQPGGQYRNESHSK